LKPPQAIFTIGHSTRSLETLLQLLRAHGVTLLVDVRTVPRSRHNPQFNQDTLPQALRKADMDYMHMKELGGLRHPRRDSTNTGWRTAGFRGYADYMETPEFETNLQQLMEVARRRQVCIMCAEAVPWRCHRSLISDALLVRSVGVEHILGEGARKPHSLTPWARVEGTRLRYPSQENQPALPLNEG